MTEPAVAASEPRAASILPAAAMAANRVYIVDDDSMVRRSLSFLLTTSGFSPRAFASGRDFLDEVEVLAPGCVLLDVRMPEIDGLAVLEALGAKVERFGVIAMTGHGDVDTAVRAMKRGARDFLEKPFTDAALTEILATVFDSLPAHADADAEREDAIARVALLTRREHDVLRGLVGGQPNKTLAYNLGISVRTVEMHRGNLTAKIGAGSLAEVIRIAVLASVEPA